MKPNPLLPAVTLAGFALAGYGMVAVGYSIVEPFHNLANRVGVPPLLFHPVLGVAALVAGMVAASVSTVLDARRRAELRRHRVDWFFVLVGLVAFWSLVSGFFESGLGRMTSLHSWLACLASVSAVGVSAGYLWETLLVRTRAGTLGRTVFWPRVFRTLPLNQVSGIFILAVIVIASGVLVVGARSSFADALAANRYFPLPVAGWLAQWFGSVILPALTLAVVAVLCRNILTITAAKQAAVEARLREEQARAELITNVTHDLRTPLTSIVNYVDLIEKLELDDPRLADYTAVLSRKAARLKGLIGDLLDASRASAGALPVRLEPIELTEALAQVSGDFDDALIARGLTWVGPSVGRRLVSADGEHLARILENLVGNAVKYAKPGSCVHAELSQAAGRVRLQLSNRTTEPLLLTGDQLAAQFVRGDAARHSEGSGLGLFIADRLARLMGARLTIEVDGDRFAATLELPAAQPAAAIDPGRWPSQAESSGSARGALLAVNGS